MLLLLLAALAQESAGDLTVTRPAGWTRQDDAAKKSVTLLPPGVPPGVLCSLTVTPPEAVAATPADWHAAVFGSLTAGGALVRGEKAQEAGAFTRSWGEVRRTDGSTVWITLYTAAAQGKGRALLFISSQPDLFQQHAGAVDLLARGAAVPGLAEAVAAGPAYSEDSVTIKAPENWTTLPGQGGAIQYIPPNLQPGQMCMFVVMPSEATTASAEAYHEGAVKATGSGLKSFKVVKTGEWGAFKYSDLELVWNTGQAGKGSVYTTRWAGRGQSAMYLCNNDNVFTWTSGWPPAVLISAYVPNPRLAPGAPFVPIVEVFFKAELEMGVTVDLRAGTAPQPTKKFLVLFKNGLALRVDAMSSGFLDGTYVAQGLASLDAEALIKETAPALRRGTWKEQDGKLVLNWSTGTAVETYAREGLRLVGPKTWSKFSLADGLKIDGLFRSENKFVAPWTLRLTKEGRFEGDGLNGAMGGRFGSPHFPEKGAGSYEIRNGTMFFRFDNGYRTSIALFLGGDDPAAPASVILNGIAFERR